MLDVFGMPVVVQIPGIFAKYTVRKNVFFSTVVQLTTDNLLQIKSVFFVIKARRLATAFFEKLPTPCRSDKKMHLIENKENWSHFHIALNLNGKI